ncbi:MAG: hypothetical protein V3S55_13835 [Nitrospiraceae bacterium]
MPRTTLQQRLKRLGVTPWNPNDPTWPGGEDPAGFPTYDQQAGSQFPTIGVDQGRIPELEQERAGLTAPMTLKQKIIRALTMAAPVGLGAIFGGGAGATGAAEGVTGIMEGRATQRRERVGALDEAIAEEQRRVDAIAKGGAERAEGRPLRAAQEDLARARAEDLRRLEEPGAEELTLDKKISQYVNAKGEQVLVMQGREGNVYERVMGEVRPPREPREPIEKPPPPGSPVRLVGEKGDVKYWFPRRAAGGEETVSPPEGYTPVTAQMEGRAESAAVLIPSVRDAMTQIKNLEAEGKLGMLAGRYNEFMAGKIGAGDPNFARLRTTISLLQTGLMVPHVGARGGVRLLEHFKAQFNTGYMSAATLEAALGAIESFLKKYAVAGGAPIPGGQPDIPEIPPRPGPNHKLQKNEQTGEYRWVPR